MNNARSQRAWQKSRKLIPGGVNSPVRAFRSVGGDPLFIKRANGSKVYDLDENEFIDYVASWGPMILGHADPKVLSAINSTMKNGTSFGAPTELEIELAELVIEAVPSIDLIRMVNSGTEATMSAIRISRGYTNREKIIKIEGCYHGHADHLLAKSGSGIATFGLPDSSGIPKDFAKHTLTVPFNSIDAISETISKNPDQIGCVIIEPIAGNMGVMPPKNGYLRELRKITKSHGIVLIFDEVMTGFRVAYGGAQSIYGIDPDLTCFGKVIGGGLPVGAYGGKREIMECVAPIGSVYQAGTLSGNPLAMSAGLATLTELKKSGVYEKLEKTSSAIAEGIRSAADRHGIPTFHDRVGSMMSCFFTDHEVWNYQTAKTCDTDRYAKFFWGMIDHGVYLAPSQFEAMFVSLAHSENDIEKTINAVDQVFATL